MLTLLSGQAHTIVVPFARDDEPFVPDGGAASYTLRGQDGSVLTTGNLTGLSDTRAAIQVSAPNNTLSGGRRFEKRSLIVTCSVDGHPFETTTSYRLTPWINLTATVADVRAFVGVGADELPDAEIDLAGAYLSLAYDLEDFTALDTALSAGDASELLTNSAIVALAVLAALPALRLRVLKKENDGARALERFEIDFDRIEADAGRAVLEAKKVLRGVVDSNTGPTLFILTTPSDPVTGA